MKRQMVTFSMLTYITDKMRLIIYERSYFESQFYELLLEMGDQVWSDIYLLELAHQQMLE